MIDWDFISALEGGRALEGYVPAAGNRGDISGVTIATGIDLGYYGNGLAALPDALLDKLLAYLGLIGAQARATLEVHPLTVTEVEAIEIETPKRSALMVDLSQHYLRSAAVPFESLPDAAQTVLASVTWQYGTPWARCPKFWKAAARRDWPGVVAELDNFGDDYPTRRNREADYLEVALGL